MRKAISKRKYPFGTISKIVSARLPVPLIQKLDEYCHEQGRSRSDTIVYILDNYLTELKK